jgi:hypothetical protein
MNMTFCQIHQDSVLTISESRNQISVSFKLPSYEIIDTNLLTLYGITDNFNYIKVNDEFGIIDSVGFPELPQLTFDLQVPNNSSDFTISVVNSYTNEIYLNYKIMPSPEDYLKTDSIFYFRMDTSYYSSRGGMYNNSTAIISEDFFVFGEQGVSLTIFPFVYNPLFNKLSVLDSAKYVLSYTTKGSVPDNYYSEVKNEYLDNIFLNYKAGTATTQGRYLMITDPSLESTLTYFANYKRNIGYTVDVETTITTGTSDRDIKSWLQKRYKDTSLRPDIVLLVGNVNKIPASSGSSVASNWNNPITDLGYARLDGDDYFADVLLGRFPIHSNGIAALQQIINKTIYMEMNWHKFDKKAKLIAGADNSFYEHWFEKPLNEIKSETLDGEGYSSHKLYQPNISQVQADINDNPLLVIYEGHGATDKWRLDKGNSLLDFKEGQILSLTNTIFPIVFSFSCETGRYYNVDNCIGISWLTNSGGSNNLKGAVTYFGSTVETVNYSDYGISKKIFGSAFKGSEARIAEIINIGKKRYWDWSTNHTRRKRYIQSYNLLGDPSLNIKGMGCRNNFVFTNNEVFDSGAIVSYSADNNIETQGGFLVKSGAKVELKAGNKIVLKPGFKAEHGSDFKAIIEPCSETAKSAIISNNINENNTYSEREQEIINPAEFSVFPNPTNSEFSICYTTETDSDISIELFNIQGVKIKDFLNINNQNLGNYYYNFSLENLPTATYVIVLKTNTKNYSCKIIKN